MNRHRIEQISLLLIAAVMLPAGLQATLTPTTFFDDFPLGRGWVSRGGDAYNGHLVRDVGVLFLAMIIVTVWTALRRRPARPIAAAWLFQGAMHLAFHARHLDGFDTNGKIGLIGSLAAVPVLALITLVAGWLAPQEAKQ